jgi:hypothetical protein
LKNTKKKLNEQSKVVRHTFTRSSIKKYSVLKTVVKNKYKQGGVNMKTCRESMDELSFVGSTRSIWILMYKKTIK